MIELHMRVPNKVYYVNWKGRGATRVIEPYRIFWGSTEFHPEDQWLIECLDCEDSVLKTFALKDIHLEPSPEILTEEELKELQQLNPELK